MLNSTEKRSLLGISIVLFLRMMGLFMVLPILAVSARDFSGATPFLIGLALGAYGLTQGLMQIPMGRLSDRIGRHKVVYAGLLFFALGSVIAALSDHIYGLIIGRFLQGFGAIAAALMALVADNTRPQYRDIAMAGIGASMGLAMMVAMIVGVIFAEKFGISAIFWLTALLALVGLALFVAMVPKAPVLSTDRSIGGVTVLRNLFANEWVRILTFGVGSIHFAIIAFFLIYPPMLQEMGWSSGTTWKVYIVALLFSIVGMAPIMMLSRKVNERFSLTVATAVLASAFMVLFIYGRGFGVYIALWMFFVGFNSLEATMPSLLSKIVTKEDRGSAMGLYATSQFFGAFLGGGICGWVNGEFGSNSVTLVTASIVVLWLLLVVRMNVPRIAENSKSTLKVPIK